MKTFDFRKQPSILIEGAMDTETAYLVEKLKEKRTHKIGNWLFHTGFLGKYEEPVIVVKTYQGMVNAAAATSLALAHFSLKAVINQGIGGGHDADVHKGEIVIGTKVIPMGAMIRPFSEAGAGIDEKNFKPLPIEIYLRETQKTKKVTEFYCDEKLIAAAEQIKGNWCTHTGIIGSADEWNNQLDRISLLGRKYHTTVEDMESAAAAQLCTSYGIPFLGIRILSNSIVNGEEFDESVGESGQKFLCEYIETLHHFGE